MKVKWNGNFQEKCFENLGAPHEFVLFFGIDANSQISQSALASSFGRDHRESRRTSHARMTATRIR